MFSKIILYQLYETFYMLLYIFFVRTLTLPSSQTSVRLNQMFLGPHQFKYEILIESFKHNESEQNDTKCLDALISAKNEYMGYEHLTFLQTSKWEF